MPDMKAKNALLIVCSLIFYAYGEPIYVLLMIGSTIVNWAFGLLVTNRNRVALAIAVITNLAFLGTFKYASMIVTTINEAFGTSLIPDPQINLPIGISFYTFQAMSYVIDVYRGEVDSQKNYANVLLYIAFFPQLIAGPIIKYHDIETQLANRNASIDDKIDGLIRFIVGLSKKILIANTMAGVADTIYASADASINIATAWIAALSYLLQIYFDFSGYSDMAIGMAKMFGFEFKENFDHPYTASSMKEFWRRWHISLSTWFKEYLYIPLGGNRKGRARTAFNKLIVFFTCGLWHGASWTFALWGLGHGFFLFLEEYLPVKKLPKAVGVVYTLLVVTLLFVLFRADNISQAWLFISQMFCGFHFEQTCNTLAMQALTPLNIFTFAVGCIASTRIAEMLTLPRWAKYVGSLALLVLCLLTLSAGGYNPFIYFRF